MRRILAIGSPGEWIRETLDSDWVGVQHANLFSQFFGGFLPDGTLLGYSSSAAGTDFYTRATFHDDWILAHSDRDALGEKSYKQVYQLIIKIQQQAENQLQKSERQTTTSQEPT